MIWFIFLVVLRHGMFKACDGYIFPCYFDTRAGTRFGIGKADAEIVEPHRCTHIIHAFVQIRNNTIVNKDDDISAFQHYRTIRELNPLMRMLVAVSGEELKLAAGNVFSRVAFGENVKEYLRNHTLDGLVMDWEFAGAENKLNFALICKTLWTVFQDESKTSSDPRLILAVSVTSTGINERYEVSELQRYVDYIFIKTYDYHGTWIQDKQLGHHTELKSLQGSLENWIKEGAPRSKLVIGLVSYGQSYAVSRTNDTLSDTFDGPGESGLFTNQAGMLSNYEICARLYQNRWARKWHVDFCAPYAYGQVSKGSYNYVAYDDWRSIRIKIEYVKQQNIAGAYLWSIDLDDFYGFCIENKRNKYPITNLIHYNLVTCGLLRPPQRLDCSMEAIIDTTVQATCPQQQRTVTYQLACYFNTLQKLRKERAKMRPRDFDFSLCTIIIHAFGDVKNGELTFEDRDLLKDYQTIKLQRPDVRMLMSVGGDKTAASELEKIVNTTDTMKTFAGKTVSFLRKIKFDGLDIYWNFTIDLKDKFLLLCKVLYNHFETEGRSSFRPRLWLTIAVRTDNGAASLYSMTKLHRYADYIHLMTYGLPSTDSEKLKNAFWHHTNLSAISHIVNKWLQNGTPRDKLLLGMALFGKASRQIDTMGEENDHQQLSYMEICEGTNLESWQKMWSRGGCGPLTRDRNGDTVSYDDVRSLLHKVNYIKNEHLGGGMLWAIPMDDDTNVCGGGRFPLTNILHHHLVRCGHIAPPTTINCSQDITATIDQPCSPDDINQAVRKHLNERTIREERSGVNSFNTNMRLLFVFLEISCCFISYI